MSSETPDPQPGSFWMRCTKEALPETKSQTPVSELCLTTLWLRLESCVVIRWDRNRAFWPHKCLSHLAKKRGQYTKKRHHIATVNYGSGSLMLWGLAASGPEHLVKISGIFYLIAQMGPWLGLPKWQWPKTHIKIDRDDYSNTKSSFCNGPLSLQTWIQMKICGCSFRRQFNGLEMYCMEEWSKAPPHVFPNLVKHWRKSAAILTRGDSTKYWKLRCHYFNKNYCY